MFRHHKAAFFTVLGYTAGGSLIFYTFTTYMQKYLINSAGMSPKTASVIMTCALFLFMCMQPLFGALSDRIGRRNCMLLFGGLGTVATVPILTALQGVSNPFVAFLLILVALTIVSFYTSISGIVKAEMFPAEVRALGVGLAYAIANAAFGGADLCADIRCHYSAARMKVIYFVAVVALMVLFGRAASSPTFPQGN